MARDKSPFPGWDPYLQQFWRDVHHRLITYTSDALRGQLPTDLRTRIEERILLEAGDWPDAPRSYVPDVMIVQPPGGRGTASLQETSTAVTEPYRYTIQAEPLTESYIEIRDMSTGGRVVTTIEFVSPTNKIPGPGMTAFKKKQQDCLRAQVSLVEIDLVRSGEHALAVPEGKIPEKDRLPPRISVTEGWNRFEFLYYPIPLQDRLPAIHIPLRKSDKPARLDIQAIFELTYRNGEYGADINYAEDPNAPLLLEEREWMVRHFRNLGLRKAA